MERCPFCKSTDLRTETRDHSEEIGGVKYASELPVIVCAKCGEGSIAGKDLEAFELSFAAELARRTARSPDAFRFMRKALGMKSVELAELLGVSKEHLSRMENGAVPIDAAWFALLGTIVLQRGEGSAELVERLRMLRTAPAPVAAKRVSAKAPAAKARAKATKKPAQRAAKAGPRASAGKRG